MWANSQNVYINREEAGLRLAQKLSAYIGRDDVLVLGIPRGGVVTAKAVSEKLNVPLSVLVTRKIGAPNQPELAIGAVGPEGSLVLDDKLIRELGVEKEYLDREIRAQSLEVSRRMKKFRVGKHPLILNLKTVVLVDDGIATGATTEAAIRYLKTEKVKKLILAVPVASADSILKLKKLVDKVVVLETPADFYAVGQFYQNFPQVIDAEVIQLLQ